MPHTDDLQRRLLIAAIRHCGGPEKFDRVKRAVPQEGERALHRLNVHPFIWQEYAAEFTHRNADDVHRYVSQKIREGAQAPPTIAAAYALDYDCETAASLAVFTLINLCNEVTT